jgi:uncharacterized protein
MAYKNTQLRTDTLKPGRRGLRYWGILLFMVLLITTLFFQSIAEMRASNPLINLLGLTISLYLGTAIFEAYRATHALRFPVSESIAARSEFPLESVVFHSLDGLKLSGWLGPTRNGAWILLTHGFSSNRTSLLPLAQILMKHGYGVLLYDLRAHGRSEGNLCTWGWLETRDLLGALDYLCSRSDVDPRRIGALGISLGGQITIRAAAETETFRAVVVENPSAAGLQDHSFNEGFSFSKIVKYPYWWCVYACQSLLTGVAQPAGVLVDVVRISPRPLYLITTGRQDGARFVEQLYTAAGEPKSIWEISEARHAGSATARPEEYIRRMVGFFDKTLLTDKPQPES